MVDRWRLRWRAASSAPGAPGTVVVANADDPMVVWAAADGPRGALGGRRPGVARRRRRLPGVRRADRLRRRRRWAVTGALRPARRGRRRGGGRSWCWPTGPGPARHRTARPVQPGQRGDGGRGRRRHARGPGRGRTWPTALAGRRRGDRGGRPVLDVARGGRRSACCWPRTRPDGRRSSTSWTRGDGRGPVVLSVNARIADGLDPSWLWDVPFERLAGRPVVATGDRRLDLAVRLRYAEVAHDVVAGPAGRRRPRAGRHGRTAARRRLPGQLHRVRRPAAGAVSAAAAAGRRRRLPRPARHLRRRRQRRGPGPTGRVAGIDVDLVQATSDRPLPAADLYTIGGGEDGPQVRAADDACWRTARWPAGGRAGRSCSAVCAGYQILGWSFPEADGRPRGGPRPARRRRP